MTTKCVNCGKTFGQHYAMRCESGSDESIWEPSTEGTQPDVSCLTNTVLLSVKNERWLPVEPSVPQDGLKIPDSRLREMVSGMDGLRPADCADTKEIDAMVPELISLRERIARLEAREAELKAEIAQPWKHSEHWRNPETGQVECDCCCGWALDAKQNADRMEALERSHKALLESMGRFLAYWESDFIKVTCADGRTLAEQMGRMTAALAAAEKLSPIPRGRTR